MSVEGLRQFRATTDPLSSGDFTAEQIALGYDALEGQPIMPSGAVLLKRRRLYPTPGAWEYCGSARRDAETVSQFTAAPHEAGMGYQYAAVRVLGNGYVSPMCTPVRVDFDGAGDLIVPPLPMWPIDVQASPVAGGKYRIAWSYERFGEGASPADFAIFEGSTPETVDYDTALGTVAYRAEGFVSTFTTAAYSDGTVHVFSVRARNSGGVAELNTLVTTSLIAEAATPAAATIAQAASRQVGS